MKRWLAIFLLCWCGCGEVTVQPLPVHFKQVGGVYSNLKMGNTTVHKAGCMMLCLTAVAAARQEWITPTLMIRALNDHGAIQVNGGLRWGETLSALSGLTGKEWFHRARVKNPRSFIKKNVLVLAHKDGHWRVAYGYKGLDLLLLDPAESTQPIVMAVSEFDRFDVWWTEGDDDG